MNVDYLNALVPPNDYGDFADFEYDQAIGKFVGHIVHHEFRGLGIPERQKRIWDLLRAHFGAESQGVSLVLAYSHEEWQEAKAESA